MNLQRQNEMAAGGNFNGRLFFKPGEKFQDYEMFTGQQTIEDNQTANTRLITNTLNANELSNLYFHPSNINVIQQNIINKVYQVSMGQFKIQKQNEQQLLIIMRSMYLQYGKNMNSNIQYQVDELNNMVVDECVRIIIPNIQQQQGYIDDITSGIKVMSYAQNVSSKSKQLNGFDSVIPSPNSN